ncbi:phage Gp37/Gp68 family protein [Nocardia otitidiscaviarum]|uniref:DUF5131 family protein n=1 Tax=Nocardia otitidiscaviarum TaxID=1823 RepID=UPI0020CD74BD|nr:phage Gp37/Gp68 family protein [Nocardia otitidiscaviarum]MCP9625248.1 phage Gp37/Gp68 family protein [Nocardia otitidiscaviarum]
MTGIEWTEATWNPVTGCDRVSPGCDHCYAQSMAARLKAMGSDKYQRDGDPRTSGPGFGVTVHPAALEIPLRWRSPRLVFVNSMSDLFHAQVPEEFIARVFAVMLAAPRHTFQVLTKRPGRARSLLRRRAFARRVFELAVRQYGIPSERAGSWWPLPNVWVGVSAEDQRWAEIRIPTLIDTPAAVRFVSCEPLLGEVVLNRFLFPNVCPNGCGCRLPDDADTYRCQCVGPCIEWMPAPALDWVIAGGESGPEARAPHPDWVRELRDECLVAGVPFFFKQWGGRTPKSAGRVLDGQVWDQMPATVGGAAWTAV